MTRRKVDNLGRIVPPSEMREALGIDKLDVVDVELQDGAIVIRKATCIFCGNETDQTYKGIRICPECVTDISVLLWRPD